MEIPENATLVLNGQFPANKTHLAFINDSSIIIAADGSLNHLIQNKIIPHFVIGDLDSADKGLIEKYNVQSIEIKDQSKTDFEKILIWCLEKKIQKISIFGIGGKDEDHHLSNLLTLNKFSQKILLEAFTDNYIITPISSYRKFKSFKNQTVSIMTFEKKSLVQSKNLFYELNQTKITPSNFSIRNRSMGNQFEIETSNKVLIFQEIN